MLEALAEIAFYPQFLPTRVEKERKAVLAEAQVSLLSLLHYCGVELSLIRVALTLPIAQQPRRFGSCRLPMLRPNDGMHGGS